jgi:hypothetical protein
MGKEEVAQCSQFEISHDSQVITPEIHISYFHRQTYNNGKSGRTGYLFTQSRFLV